MESLGRVWRMLDCKGGQSEPLPPRDLFFPGSPMPRAHLETFARRDFAEYRELKK
jgi:hypothetical protein